MPTLEAFLQVLGGATGTGAVLGLWLYITRGIEPGSFLMAVLENNLMEAFGRADEMNRGSMFEICQFVYNHLPAACHGSPEKVSRWMKLFNGTDQQGE